MGKTLTIVIVVILGVLAFWYLNNNVSITVSPSPTASSHVTTSATPASTQNNISTGKGISFSYSSDFGLATSGNQVPANSYIPACDKESMDYCLYYKGTDYQGTNFESAGLRIQQRPTLLTKTACTNSIPDGYNSLVPTVTEHSGYTTSVFAPIGDAAAGHYANGSLYRVWFGTTCYEFETRVGETQFANYPAGSIKEFSDANREAIIKKLLDILSSVTINSTSAHPF
jgi:hypothetical protein